MKEQFLQELKALLTKYNADIYASCDETQGVSGEQIEISMREDNKDVTVKLIDGWGIDQYNI